MLILLGMLAISTTILMILSDKIIEHYLPNGGLARMADEVDNIMIALD